VLLSATPASLPKSDGNDFRRGVRVLLDHHVNGGHRQKSLDLSGPVRNFPLTCRALGRNVRPREDMVMRKSPSFVAPSAVVILSTVLLCGPATSQTPTGSAKPLPGISVEAPKQVARPNRTKQVANTVASRRRSSTAQTSLTARTPAPGSILGRIAKLEKVASNCNGGCESSVRHGNLPWVGCSESAGGQTFGPFSVTCRDNLTYKSYVDCVETKWFLGEYRNRAYWLCSSLDAAGKFQVAELKRSRHPH
jgi:hypothetical protein